MAARKMNMLEKIANVAGPIYRHHAAQYPRRIDILKKVILREVAPPAPSEWAAVKKDFNSVVQYLDAGAYRNLSVREALVYAAVFIEVITWFFIGEIIGKRNVAGYIIPGTYVYEPSAKKAKKLGVGELQGIDDYKNLVV